MDSTTKTIKVNIPAKIQEKIDEGNYKLNGTEVRDKLGRIVCNLKSLDSDDTHYFSPHIFLQFENCTFISSTALSSRLHENMEELKT
ncbi:MAG: hypothetical protein NTZ64_15415 [Polaromonas sp.]|nr:hypothetical protein [Polaromonas sp.]